MERSSRPSTPAGSGGPSRSQTPQLVHSLSASSARRVSSLNPLSAHPSSGNPPTATVALSGHPPHDRSITGTPVSCSSSASGADAGDNGMLLVANFENEMDAEGEVKAADGDTRQALRESLRNSLTRKEGKQLAQRARQRSLAINDIPYQEGTLYPPRQYFVITHAGKPVFMSRRQSPIDNEQELVNAMGIIQALVSVYADDDDKIRCINAGQMRITFLLRAPLYYACVSFWNEPESVARLHLEYLHLQILSVVTGSQLSKIFERRTNFDLRRLLDGSETFLYSLIDRMEFDMGITTASLSALRIDQAVRAKAADSLIPPKDMKDLLYALLVVGTRVVTLVRPRKHSVHPSDLHLLINTLSSSSISSSVAASSWLPICLPKFNPNGFLHVFVTFLSDNTTTSPQPEADEAKPGDGETTLIPADKPIAHHGPTRKASIIPSQRIDDSRVGLALVTAERDGFEKLRGWAAVVTESLTTHKVLDSILSSSRMQDYTASELGIPGLRHFVYKSRTHVQLTSPVWEEPYDDLDDRRRLVTLYQILHDSVHARSGQGGGPLKLQYIKTDKESVLCWVTTPFELWVTLSPRVPKSAAVGAANAVTRWVKKEEPKLFLRDAPVF